MEFKCYGSCRSCLGRVVRRLASITLTAVPGVADGCAACGSQGSTNQRAFKAAAALVADDAAGCGAAEAAAAREPLNSMKAQTMTPVTDT